MPASRRNSVLLPAPLPPMMPTRSPSLKHKQTSCKARTFMTGLAARRNIPRRRYSLSVIWYCSRTRKIMLTWSSLIRGILSIPPNVAQEEFVMAGRASRGSQVKDDPFLQASQEQQSQGGDEERSKSRD